MAFRLIGIKELFVWVVLLSKTSSRLGYLNTWFRLGMVSVETNEYPQVYIPLLIDFALMRIMAHGLLCFVWTLDKVYELQEPRLAFMSQFKNNKLSEWWVITIFLTAAFCIIILNVYFRSSWIMIKVIKVILMVMLMVYSADTLNEKVIKEIWRQHSPLLEEFLRRVKVTPLYLSFWILTVAWQDFFSACSPSDLWLHQTWGLEFQRVP